MANPKQSKEHHQRWVEDTPISQKNREKRKKKQKQRKKEEKEESITSSSMRRRGFGVEQSGEEG